MLDFLMIALTVGFLFLTVGYLALCERVEK
jgi:hypothetical protein